MRQRETQSERDRERDRQRQRETSHVCSCFLQLVLTQSEITSHPMAGGCRPAALMASRPVGLGEGEVKCLSVEEHPPPEAPSGAHSAAPPSREDVSHPRPLLMALHSQAEERITLCINLSL